MKKIDAPFSTNPAHVQDLESRILAVTSQSVLETERRLLRKPLFSVPDGFYDLQYMAILAKKTKYEVRLSHPIPALTKLAPAMLGLLIVLGIGLSPNLMPHKSSDPFTIISTSPSGAMMESFGADLQPHDFGAGFSDATSTTTTNAISTIDDDENQLL